jgi:hypothetical protein
MTTEAAVRAYSRWAQEFKLSIGTCEICREFPLWVPGDRQALEVHHIGSGEDKCITRTDRRTVLCLCPNCHDAIDELRDCPLCHRNSELIVGHRHLCQLCGVNREVRLWPVARQLAVLMLRRRQDLDVPSFNAMVNGSRRVSESDVRSAADELLESEWWRN